MSKDSPLLENGYIFVQTIVSANSDSGLTVRLRDFMESNQGWGHAQGALLAAQVQSHVEEHPASIVRLELQGIERMDVTFVGELVRFVSHERQRLGFCLVNVSDEDLLMNWDAAACKLGQPLFAWDAEMRYRLLGPEPSVGLREMLQYVLSVPLARTTDAALALHLKMQNASNKLKLLWNEGYVLRREHSADSGGLEYEYLRIM